MGDPPVCDRCPGTMEHAGRISLPPHTIYKCDRCGNTKWLADRPPPYQPPSPNPEQPQVQQQQQPQADGDKKE
jgi:hypothetical protein